MHKKILIPLIFISTLIFVDAGLAQEEGTVEPRTIETEQKNEDVAETAEDVEDNSDMIFTVYTHEDCPHCLNLEEFVSENEISTNVEYVQLKNNDVAFAELESVWVEFDASEQEQGWPFAVYTNSEGERDYAVGDQPIIDEMISLLNIDEPVLDDTENGSTSNSVESDNTFLILLGGFFFLAVVGYGIYSYVSKPKDGLSSK